ncbi:hypothetical protein D3C81_473740 [compost metagenome]
MKTRIAIAASLFTLCTAAQARDGFTLGTGFDYSSGDYGSDTTTEIVSVPVTANWRYGNFNARVSVPWWRVSGDPNVLPEIGDVNNNNPLGRGRLPLIGGAGQPSAENQRGTASGLGDVVAAMAWTVPLGASSGLDLGVNAKIATADEDKGLGTGSNDYGATLDAYRDFDGTLLFGGIGRTKLGSAEYIALKEHVDSVNLGLSQRLGKGRIGAMVEQRSASTHDREDRRDATVFYARGTNSGRVQFHASRGFTDGGSKWGAGVSISTGF